MVSLTSQLSALRRLKAADADRALLSRRITSGLSVANTADTTDTVARSRTITRTTNQLTSVQSTLDTGIAAVAAASSATTAASDTLTNMRAVLAAAKNPAADLRSLQSQFTALNNTLRTTVSGASFLGVNLLATGASTSFDAAPTDERGQTYAIGVDLSRTRLLDPFGASGILQQSFDLSGVAFGVGGSSGTGGLGGTSTSIAGQAVDSRAPATDGLAGVANVIDGKNASTPSKLGLETASTVTGVAAGDRRAIANIGTFDASKASLGDTIDIAVTAKLDGVVSSKTLTVYQRNITDGSTLRTNLQAALDLAFGTNKVIASVDTAGKVNIGTAAVGANQSVEVTGITVRKGDDKTTTILGLTKGTDYTTSQKTFSGGQRYYADLGVPNFSGLDRGDRLDIVVRVEGESTDNKLVFDLSNVTDLSSLVSAINNVIDNPSSNAYTKINNPGSMRAAEDNGKLVIYSTNTAKKIYVASITAFNGNFASTTGKTFGLTTGSGTGTTNSPGTAASTTTGADFSALTLENGAALSFNLKVNDTSKLVTINESTVRNALGTSTGAIGDINQFVIVATRALADAGVVGVTVAASGNRLRFTKSGTFADGDSVTVSSVQAVASSATQAKLTTGTAFRGPITIDADASLAFTLRVGNADKQIMVTHGDVKAALGVDTGAIQSAAELARVVQTAMTRQNLTTVTVGAADDKLVFVKTEAGAATLALSDVRGSSDATKAVATAGNTFTGPIMFDSDAAIKFGIQVDTATGTGSMVDLRIDKATVQSALGSNRTSIETIDEFRTVAEQALKVAGILATDPNGITVGTTADRRLTFTRNTAGVGSVTLGTVTRTVGAGNGNGVTKLDTIDLGGDDMSELDAADRSALIDGYIRNLDTISAAVASAGSHLSMVARQLDIQSAHTARLSTIETGRLNSQVKTDMDRDTARKAALEARIALARQSLGIISESRKNVLALLTPLN